MAGRAKDYGWTLVFQNQITHSQVSEQTPFGGIADIFTVRIPNDPPGAIAAENMFFYFR
jgi:hypothetical protein